MLKQSLVNEGALIFMNFFCEMMTFNKKSEFRQLRSTLLFHWVYDSVFKKKILINLKHLPDNANKHF